MSIDKKMPVLVVEDDPNLRKIIITILKKLGFTNLREAENGQQAWTTMVNVEIKMIITDLNMPVMDGLQLAKLVRAKEKFNDVTILVVTANDTQETIVKAGKAGVDGYLVKPFDVKQIVKKLEDAIHLRQERAGGAAPAPASAAGPGAAASG